MPARWPLYRYLIRTVYKSVGDPICSNPVSNFENYHFENSLSFQKLSKIPPTHTQRPKSNDHCKYLLLFYYLFFCFQCIGKILYSQLFFSILYCLISYPFLLVFFQLFSNSLSWFNKTNKIVDSLFNQF
jgi:hypothetical protein